MFKRELHLYWCGVCNKATILIENIIKYIHIRENSVAHLTNHYSLTRL